MHHAIAEVAMEQNVAIRYARLAYSITGIFTFLLFHTDFLITVPLITPGNIQFGVHGFLGRRTGDVSCEYLGVLVAERLLTFMLHAQTQTRTLSTVVRVYSIRTRFGGGKPLSLERHSARTIHIPLEVTRYLGCRCSEWELGEFTRLRSP